MLRCTTLSLEASHDELSQLTTNAGVGGSDFTLLVILELNYQIVNTFTKQHFYLIIAQLKFFPSPTCFILCPSSIAYRLNWRKIRLAFLNSVDMNHIMNISFSSVYKLYLSLCTISSNVWKFCSTWWWEKTLPWISLWLP